MARIKRVGQSEITAPAAQTKVHALIVLVTFSFAAAYHDGAELPQHLGPPWVPPRVFGASPSHRSRAKVWATSSGMMIVASA